MACSYERDCSSEPFNVQGAQECVNLSFQLINGTGDCQVTAQTEAVRVEAHWLVAVTSKLVERHLLSERMQKPQISYAGS
jgi:hypothetical protein